jgi:crotonobetainyl-CoA:carnitine CoA-transferase CaiB-like acyl-CoA transferase
LLRWIAAGAAMLVAAPAFSQAPLQACFACHGANGVSSLPQIPSLAAQPAVNDVAQALDNAFVAERGSIQEFAYPDGRAARLIANPLRLSDAELPKRAAPALGGDTDALLAELGYSPEKISDLRRLRIVA